MVSDPSCSSIITSNYAFLTIQSYREDYPIRMLGSSIGGLTGESDGILLVHCHLVQNRDSPRVKEATLPNKMRFRDSGILDDTDIEAVNYYIDF